MNNNVKRYFEEYILPPNGFIYNDIGREINLARSGDRGGNFLAALGLLCYTEFMGKILLKDKENSRTQFNVFFESLGEEYSKLIKIENMDVYGVLRCGMAHAYFAQNCDIKMLNDNYNSGIIIQEDGTYLFIVEKYFEDFIVACKNLYDNLIENQNPFLPST